MSLTAAYHQEDRSTAQALANALAKLGLDVELNRPGFLGG
jgi:hypothetical protein